MTVAAGFRGRVEIDGKIFRANRWSVEYTLETDDATGTAGIPTDPFDNKDTSGKHKLPVKTYYPKVVDISVTIEAFFDSFHGYFTASGKNEGGQVAVNVYMVPGREVAVTLYPAKDILNEAPSFGRTDTYWEFKKLLITSCSHSTEARGVGKISFTGKNNSKDFSFNNI